MEMWKFHNELNKTHIYNECFIVSQYNNVTNIYYLLLFAYLQFTFTYFMDVLVILKWYSEMLQ